MVPAFFLGAGAAVLGALGLAAWIGLGLLFGMPFPTESQGGGVMVLSATIGATVGLVVSFFAD